jgi:hypothetical protein
MAKSVVDESVLTRVAALWDEAVNQEMANSEEVSFEAFLGAQYSIAAMAGQCTITKEGFELVEVALNELVQLVELEDEDLDEDDEDDE